MKMPYGSIAYKNATYKEVEKACTGCGSVKTAFLNFIMGVHIRQACCAHDYEYMFQTVSRKQADIYFYLNLKYLIERERLSPFMESKARAIAMGYYLAVRKLGWIFY